MAQSYLDTLVLKEDYIEGEPEVGVEVVAEVTPESDEPNEQFVMTEEVAAQDVEAVTTSNVEPDEPPVTVPYSDAQAEAEIASEEVDSSTGHEIDEIIPVENIKIYSVPSTNGMARTFTGNIKYLGEVDRFKVIEYVRAGFGLVKGYTVDEF